MTVFEYRPKPVEKAEFSSGETELTYGKEHSLLSWNIGYGGLGKYETFFMDGGEKVRPESKKIVEQYLTGIEKTIAEYESDIVFLQEVDRNSKRTWFTDEFERLKKTTGRNGAFTYNYNCLYVPYPLPTIGRVQSGLVTLSNWKTDSAERIALPVPFKWPVRLANLKRCLLVEKLPIYENGIKTEKYLVLANLHLEAYDSGEGKIAQTKALVSFMQEEYEKGNYVIAGGDFNQKFPGSEAFPPFWKEGWQPASIQLPEDFIEQGWTCAYDDSKPTCRSIRRTYVGELADKSLVPARIFALIINALSIKQYGLKAILNSDAERN